MKQEEINDNSKAILEKEEEGNIVASINDVEEQQETLLDDKNNKNERKKEKKEEEKEKDDPLFDHRKKITMRDGILTLIGNEFHRISFGCIMVIFNLTTYLISYLRHYQEKKTITLQYTYFIGPIMSITMGIFTPMVGMIENKIGLKLSVILGGILSLWSCVILYYSKNYYFDLFAFFVNSLGSSMAALMTRNIMGYFFHVRGKLSGILSVISSLVSSGYNVVGENWIVNPKSEEATVDNSYYTFEVCQNLLKFFRICWICLSVGTIMTVIFVVPFDSSKHVKLFKPKIPEDFVQKKMKKFEKKKDIKKEEIEKDEKIGPLMPEEEKKEENKEKKIQNVEENLNIENEKEIKEEERDKVNLNDIKLKKKDKNKSKNKNDLSKTSSVPVILVANKNRSLFSEDNPDNVEEKMENLKQKNTELKQKRSLSISYKEVSASKFPLINFIEEIEVVAIAHPRKSIKKKFSIQLIKRALKSRRVLFLFLMGLFSAPLGNILTSTWRPIGIRKSIPTRYLQNIGTYRPFVTCASSFIFSILTDYVQFRYLYLIFSVLSTFIGVIFCFTFKSPIFFTFIILLNSVVFAGKMSITSPHYMKVFGLKYYIEIGGVIGLSRVFMSPLCTVFIFIFETYIAPPKDGKIVSDTPYIILYFIIGLLNIIAAILCMFETEEKLSP